MDIWPEELETRINDDIKFCNSLEKLEQLRVNYFGKSGLITNAFKELSSLDLDTKKRVASELNTIKEKYLASIAELKEKLNLEILQKELSLESLDLSLPSRKLTKGKLHPITKVIHEITDIFANIGFTFADGPNIEDDFHNFEALNFPEHHPARAMHDTFYLKNGHLLRTHTSSVQIRWMEKNQNPPYKLMSVGRTYRADYDMTHTPMFHQIEGLVIQKSLTMADLKTCLQYFLNKFFEIDNLPMRLRPSFFPFTEPSAEVDIGCIKKDNKITIGSGDNWLEILGCGMVHPNVLRNVGIDPTIYKGFAFGVGVERLAMLKYGIPDLREFFYGDKRWLNNFNFSLIDFIR
jgi:phenylalanyl-tRNA synthetase alpha chain